jgi:short-subunit dehydrogenase
MKNIVVTGSTRGIGYGLARGFLLRGCRVVICGRKQQDVDQAVYTLSQFGSESSIVGTECDVTEITQVENLWNKAQEAFGSVDIWINNAGISHAQIPFWELPLEEVNRIIATNITGLMTGSSIAARGMIKQGYGAIFNMEGLGSNRMKIYGLSVYGTTKAAVRYFSEALRKEIGSLPITIGELLPGMVVTDLLTDQKDSTGEEWQKNKKVYNILANREEVVTTWLVKRILTNSTRKAVYKYVTLGRMARQLFAAIFLKRDLFGESNLK